MDNPEDRKAISVLMIIILWTVTWYTCSKLDLGVIFCMAAGFIQAPLFTISSRIVFGKCKCPACTMAENGTIYTFHREGGFYPVMLKSDEEVALHVEQNPGTLKVINEKTGKVVFEAGKDG